MRKNEIIVIAKALRFHDVNAAVDAVSRALKEARPGRKGWQRDVAIRTITQMDTWETAHERLMWERKRAAQLAREQAPNWGVRWKSLYAFGYIGEALVPEEGAGTMTREEAQKRCDEDPTSRWTRKCHSMILNWPS